jgi:type I restriction enzyme, S subunit
MTMRDGLVDQSSKFKKVVASRDLTSYKVVRQGQLVVGFPIDEAVLAIQRIHPAGIVSPAYDVWDVRTELVDPDYLERYLKSPRAISYYVAKLRGSTARRRSLPKPDFDGMPVPLPPLPEQRRIASILDQSDQSIRAIESRLHLLAELESSVFFDVASRANAPRVPLADIAVTTSGGTPSRDVAEYYGPGHFWVKSGEVNQDSVLETEETITSAGLSNSSAKLMPAGTVLLAMYGATAGEVGLLGVEAATNQAVCCITPREGVSAEYLVMALKAQRATLKSLAVGGAQPNLSQGQIRTLLLPLLDSRDQARLAEATRSIHELKKKAQAQLRTSADLSTSLRHQAFSGTL